MASAAFPLLRSSATNSRWRRAFGWLATWAAGFTRRSALKREADRPVKAAALAELRYAYLGSMEALAYPQFVVALAAKENLEKNYRTIGDVCGLAPSAPPDSENLKTGIRAHVY